MGTGRPVGAVNAVALPFRQLTPAYVDVKQLSPDGLSAQPVSSINTQSYGFCRFASGVVATQSTGDGADADEHCAASSSGRCLVAVAGTDTAAVELWDLDAGTAHTHFQCLARLHAFSHALPHRRCHQACAP